MNDAERSPLGIITNTASQLQNYRESNRFLNFALQAAARTLLPGHRVGWCLRRVQLGADSVDVKKSPESGKLFYSNLIRCNRLWACPVCSAAISEKRKKALATGLIGVKLEVSMFTYTIRHNKGMSCKEVVDTLTEGYRKFTSGRQYQAILDAYQIKGSLRALEVTYGENGYHPHIHVFILSKPGLCAQKGHIELVLLERWKSFFDNPAYKPDEHGVMITSDGDMADYVAKISGDESMTWGLVEELTKQPSKEGRKDGKSPKALLLDYLRGDEKSGYIWSEIVSVLSGRKQLVPSRNFWALLNVEEPTEDNEETEPEKKAEILASIDLEQWRVICRHERRGEVLERLEKGEALQSILFDEFGNRSNWTETA